MTGSGEARRKRDRALTYPSVRIETPSDYLLSCAVEVAKVLWQVLDHGIRTHISPAIDAPFKLEVNTLICYLFSRAGCPQDTFSVVFPTLDSILIRPLVDAEENLDTIVAARFYRYDDAIERINKASPDAEDEMWASLARCLRDQVVGAEFSDPEHSDAQHALTLSRTVQERCYRAGIQTLPGYFDGDGMEAVTLDIFVTECTLYIGAYFRSTRAVCKAIQAGELRVDVLEEISADSRAQWYSYLQFGHAHKILRLSAQLEDAVMDVEPDDQEANDDVLSYCAPHWTALEESLYDGTHVALPLGARFELAVLYYSLIQDSELPVALRKPYLAGSWNCVQDYWFRASQEDPAYAWVEQRVAIYRHVLGINPEKEEATYWLRFAECFTAQLLSQSSSNCIDRRISLTTSRYAPEPLPEASVSSVHLLNWLGSRVRADRIVASSLLQFIVPFQAHLKSLA